MGGWSAVQRLWNARFFGCRFINVSFFMAIWKFWCVLLVGLERKPYCSVSLRVCFLMMFLYKLLFLFKAFLGSSSSASGSSASRFFVIFVLTLVFLLDGGLRDERVLMCSVYLGKGWWWGKGLNRGLCWVVLLNLWVVLPLSCVFCFLFFVFCMGWCLWMGFEVGSLLGPQPRFVGGWMGLEERS